MSLSQAFLFGVWLKAKLAHLRITPAPWFWKERRGNTSSGNRDNNAWVKVLPRWKNTGHFGDWNFTRVGKVPSASFYENYNPQRTAFSQKFGCFPVNSSIGIQPCSAGDQITPCLIRLVSLSQNSRITKPPPFETEWAHLKKRLIEPQSVIKKTLRHSYLITSERELPKEQKSKPF